MNDTPLLTHMSKTEQDIKAALNMLLDMIEHSTNEEARKADFWEKYWECANAIKKIGVHDL